MATNRVSPKAMRRAGLHNVGEQQYVEDYLQDVWKRREFAVAVPLGQLRTQHMNTLLGNLWHVLNPLLIMGVYYLLFGVILGTNRGTPNFLGFLAVGVFTFHYTQRTVTSGAAAVSSNSGIIRAIYFPRAILPLQTVIGQTLSFVPAIFTMLVVTMLSGVLPRPTWLLLIPLFAVQALFNLGATFVVARIGDSYRDITQVLPHIFRVLIYVSGAMYSVDRFIHSALARHLFELNPMYSFLSLARGAVLGLPTTIGMYASVATWTFVLLVGGFFFFRAGEHAYGRA
ncbi:MAG: teichoic acid transport system permease protein [Actinomycetota bacterium]|nr:teichoic acid transport system permease protein [Actinomycetota bacterium]